MLWKQLCSAAHPSTLFLYLHVNTYRRVPGLLASIQGFSLQKSKHRQRRRYTTVLSQQEFRRSEEHSIIQAIAGRLFKKKNNPKLPKTPNSLLLWGILCRMVLRLGIKLGGPISWSVTVQEVMEVHFKGPQPYRFSKLLVLENFYKLAELWFYVTTPFRA